MAFTWGIIEVYYLETPGLTIVHLSSESIAQYILFALVWRMQRVPHLICGSVTSLTRAN